MRETVVTGAVLDLFSCLGHLALAILVLLRPARSPLVWPLALLCLDMFAWTFADFAFLVSDRPRWHWLDLALSPFSPALALHFIMTFTGTTQAKRLILLVVYACASALALVSALAFVLQPARAWIASLEWSAGFLVYDVLALGLSLSWLVLHRARTVDADEKTRTNVVMGAMVIGAILAATDFVNDFDIAIPSLASIGALCSTVLLAMTALRFRVFGRNLTLGLAALSSALAVGGILGYLALFRWLGEGHGVVMIATTTLTLVLVAFGRQLFRRYIERRDRVEALVSLGRFSAQMTHDLKNPLAALRGAVEYLQEENVRGGSLEAQGQILKLLAQQLDRIDGVVDGYARHGRMQPQRTEVDLNDVVRNVLALQNFVRADIAVNAQLEANLPPCLADPELVGRAVENLVRNSVEAMPKGGALAVRTAVHTGKRRRGQAAITVEDQGTGMDARQVAQAFRDFYTTKPLGSGLGLGFIKRVVEAHGGHVKLSSQLGAGTRVTLLFPITASESGNGRTHSHR